MTYILLAITGLFMISLIARQKLKAKFCAICVSIGLTWIGLLLLYESNRYHDSLLLGLLMGQSITGLYYVARQRLPKSLRVFTLPYFLTATVGLYMLLRSQIILSAFGLLLGLWVLAWVVFAYRNDPAKKLVAKAAMECCEDK